MLAYVSVLFYALLSFDREYCFLLLCYHLQFMIMALHIITITMKRIPKAIAMDRARKNADAVKGKRKMREEGLGFQYLHV